MKNTSLKTMCRDSLFCRGVWLAVFLFCSVGADGADGAAGAPGAFSVSENAPGFAEHEARVRQFKEQRARFLKERQRQTGRASSQQKQKQKERDQAFLRHRDKSIRFEQSRKAAFPAYKKQRQEYLNRQAAVLRIRQACVSSKKESPCILSPAF